MDEIREKLRADFYAKTDITPGGEPCSWKIYAEYLENISVEKINEETLRKYNKLYERVGDIMELMETVLSER